MPRCEDCIHNKVCAEVNSLKCRPCFIWYDAKSGCPYFVTDVVPRSEFARVATELERVEALYFAKDVQVKQLKEDTKRLREINDALSEFQAKEKTKAAREIFEDMESNFITISLEDFSRLSAIGKRTYAKIKKKYTEVIPNDR